MDTSIFDKLRDPPPSNTNILCPGFCQANLRDIIRGVSLIKPKLGVCDKDLETFKFELKLLSQILYKNHNRFRNDKGYKDARMLEKSANKFVNHNFVRPVSNFLNLIPSSASVSIKVYLPPVTVAEYSLLQLLGAGALLSRIETCAKNTGQLLLQRLNLGHFWNVAAYELAVISRLWAVARHILTCVNDVYKIIANVSKHFPDKNLSGPKSALPKSLDQYLPEDEIKPSLKSAAESSVSKLGSISLVSENNSNDQLVAKSCYDLGVPVKRNELMNPPSASSSSIVGPSKEVVNIDTLTSKNRKRKKAMKNAVLPNVLSPVDNVSKCVTKAGKEVANNNDGKLKKVLKEIRCLDALKLFLNSESSARKTSRKTSISRKLDQESWKKLKREVLQNINTNKPNKSLKMGKMLIKSHLNNLKN
jgi:hypothetical protein